MKGYQIIEPEFISVLNKLNFSLELEYVIYSWILEELKKDEELNAYRIEIDLIFAKRVNVYPCLGIHYLDKEPEDLELLIQGKIDKLYQSLSFHSFFSHIANNIDAINERLKNRE